MSPGPLHCVLTLCFFIATSSFTSSHSIIICPLDINYSSFCETLEITQGCEQKWYLGDLYHSVGGFQISPASQLKICSMHNVVFTQYSFCWHTTAQNIAKGKTAIFYSLEVVPYQFLNSQVSPSVINSISCKFGHHILPKAFSPTSISSLDGSSSLVFDGHLESHTKTRVTMVKSQSHEWLWLKQGRL